MLDPLQEIVRQIAAVTGRDPGEIDVDQPFAAMGIESLEAVAIVANLSEKLGRPIDATGMFDYPNVRRLAEFLSDPARGGAAPRAARVEAAAAETFEPIAIVGMGCHLPGARSVDAFWKLLRSETDAITDVPPTRWQSRPGSPTQGGFVEGVDEFDPDLFGINDLEAAKMDPQQRLLMQVAWTAIEDAGYAPSQLAGTRTGVFVGIGSSDYSMLRAAARGGVDVYDATGNAHSIAANRLSFALDLRGPSVSVDTACSSSLVAVHLACTALRTRECDTALSAGVNLMFSRELTDAFADAQMLSPTSRCRTFSSKANGYVRGEGAGVVVLKRLSDAIRDRDPVWAVVRGSAVNQDGRSASLTAPNGPAQEDVIRAAHEAGQVKAAEIEYVEAHGTGTPLGDPIEYMSLSRALGQRAEGRPVRVGSVKTNIGHLEAAAGIAGLIKTVLALKHRWIPASLHFDEINPRIGDRAPNLAVPKTGMPWDTDARRIAGVSSFGFGGTNAHVVLQEFDAAPPAATEEPSGRAILCASATDRAGVRAMAQAYRERIGVLQPAALRAMADASIATRMDLPHRLVVHGRSAPELDAQLAAFLADKARDGWAYAQRKRGGPRKLAFVFTGQGAQYAGMGAGLYAEFATYRKAFDDCCEGFDRLLERDLRSLVLGPEAGKDQDLFRTDYGQAAIFSAGYALAKLLSDDYQVKPAAVFGHSVGEILASCVAGAIALPEAIRLVAARGTLMQRTPEGRMLAVFAPEPEVRGWISETGGVDLAAINGPSLMIASGDPTSIDRLEARLTSASVKHRRLKNTRGFHSRLMDGALDAFERAASRVHFGAAAVPIVSSLTGEVLGGPQDAAYWRRHLREPTQYLAAVKTLDAIGVNGLLEIGPQPTLAAMGKACLPPGRVDWFTCLAPERDAGAGLHQCLAELAAGGFWSAPARGWRAGVRPADLPPFTIFQRKKLWAHVRPMTVVAEAVFEAPALPPAPADGGTVDDSRGQRVLEDLTGIVASLLDVSASEVNIDEPLVDTGADSLLLLNAIQTVKDKYQVTIAISDVFQELSTVRKLAGYVAANLPPEAPKAAPRAAPVAQSYAQPAYAPPPPAAFAMPNLAPATGDVRSLVDQQLRVMAMQLQLLGGNGGAMAHPAPVAPAPVAPVTAPAAPREQKGVLGNFATKANLEHFKVGDGVREKYLADLITRFTRRTAKSKARSGVYRKYLADNRVSAGFRPNIKEMVYPIICERAKGSRFHDLDGNEYIDFTMGFGVNLFGHSPDFIESAIVEQVGRGMAVGPQSALAGPVAKKMAEMVGAERVAFLNSGTEAVMTAIRLARAATGREKIVLFDGSYHGHFDGVLARPLGDGSVPVAPGVTRGFVSDVLVLDYGTPESLEAIRRHAGELAAVVCETVQSRYPEHQPGEFLKEVRSITEAGGAALIFDEVITGFRIHTGGAQAHFGIRADLCSYGKILGGGMPIGAIGGKARFLDFIDGGGWEFGDTSYPKNDMTFFAGTFCKHPLAMAAANAVLDRLHAEGDRLLSELNARTAKLAADVNAVFDARGVDIRCNTFGSLFRFKAAANLDLLFYNLNLRGAYVWEGRNMFLSTAHTDEDVRAFVKIVEESVDELVRHEILKSSKATARSVRAEYPLVEPQERFRRLAAQGPDGEAASHVCVAVKMKGPLQPDKLWSALKATMEIYDAFRLRFDLAKGVQRFADAVELTHAFVDLTEADSRWKELDRRLREEGRRPFDLEREPPIRFILFQMGEENAILSMVCHHAALDGWSIAQFIEDVAKVYVEHTGGEKAVLKPGMQFEKFLAHPERFGGSRKMEAARAYWESRFPQAPRPIHYSKSGTPGVEGLAGERYVLDLPGQIHKKVKAAAKAWKMSPLVIMLTGFARLVAELDPAPEVTLGVPAGNRDLEGADRMVGSCANLLPVRVPVNLADSAEDAAKKVKTDLYAALQHMVHPYEELEAKVGRVFNVSFNLEPLAELPDFGNVTLFLHPYPITASEFDLTVNVSDLEYFYHVEADFKSTAAKLADVEKLVERYGKILDEMLPALP